MFQGESFENLVFFIIIIRIFRLFVLLKCWIKSAVFQKWFPVRLLVSLLHVSRVHKMFIMRGALRVIRGVKYGKI